MLDARPLLCVLVLYSYQSFIDILVVILTIQGLFGAGLMKEPHTVARYFLISCE
jgi:hypothetical protein